MANPTMTLISSQTLGGATASVTFSSIPSTYNDLKLVISARIDVATFPNTVKVTFNGDTGTNYSETNVQGNSSVAGSNRGTSETSFGPQGNYLDAASNTASTFTPFELYIPNYASTAKRPMLAIGTPEQNDTTVAHSIISANAGLYAGASGISSITLTPSSGNFVQYSDFYLYGIKNS